jgi:PDZ domain-containing secreted protein
MKIIFSDNVKKENLDKDGNLQSGMYNVTFKGMLTFLPLFIAYDGKEWDQSSYMIQDYMDSKDDGEMTVWVRTQDLKEKEQNKESKKSISKLKL